MEPQEKLKQIEDEIRPWLSLMGRLADNVLDEQVSKYPIFVVHPATIELGLPIVEKGDKSRWSIHILSGTPVLLPSSQSLSAA